MTRIYSKVSALALVVTFAAMLAACSVTPPDPTGSTPDQAVRVITAEDTAQLGPDHRLTLDVRFESYRIDASAGPVDLTYVDVVDPTGHIDTIEHVITQIVDNDNIAREDFERGFSVSAAGDQLQLGGSIIDGTTRGVRCFACACTPSACACLEVKCPTQQQQ